MSASLTMMTWGDRAWLNHHQATPSDPLEPNGLLQFLSCSEELLCKFLSELGRELKLSDRKLYSDDQDVLWFVNVFSDYQDV